MSYSLRENLEVYTDAGATWIRCGQCLHLFCRADEDWRKASKIRRLAPTMAGPLMKDLLGHFLLEQLCCPSCGALLNTDLVEEKSNEPVNGERSIAGGPKKPRTQPAALDSKTTAVLVLDLSARCHDPELTCSSLLPVVGPFLQKARELFVPIIFTVSKQAKGTPLGEVASLLGRKEKEPVIYPDGFDKFTGGELQDLLAQRKIRSLVIVGAATNVAVLYTATTASRVFRYDVIIPVDGVIARSGYEQEYTFHQLASLPASGSRHIRFSTLPTISFQSAEPRGPSGSDTTI